MVYPMTDESSPPIAATVDAVYRSDSRRVFATLVRLLGDFDIAEEALHDAFRAAPEQWPRVAGFNRALQGDRRHPAALALRRLAERGDRRVGRCRARTGRDTCG